MSGSGGFTELLAKLVDGAMAEDVLSGAKRDMYLYLVLSVIPWVWSTVTQEWGDELKLMYLKIKAYVKAQRVSMAWWIGVGCFFLGAGGF